MAKFAVVLTFGDPDKVAETRPRHREYLQRLLSEGRLHASGPWADGTGALVIYEAADEAEALALLGADPYTEAGVIAEARIKEWNRVFAAEP